MGHLEETMKKLLLALLFYCSALHADQKFEALKQYVCQVIPTLGGWCSEEKALNFMDLVMEVQPDTCVEIGVFAGKSLYPVAATLKYLNHGVVIAIDPWDKMECIKYYDETKDQEDLKWWSSLNLNYIYYSFLDLLYKHELENYCKIFRYTSEKAASMIGTIDILYIDGNHSEPVSMRDVELYLPKVRSGGYIWMNDTQWPQRAEATEYLRKNCDTVKFIDDGTCILFKQR